MRWHRQFTFLYKVSSIKKKMFYITLGVIRGQLGVYHEIVYEAEVFNRLNPEPKAREFNLLNTDAS